MATNFPTGLDTLTNPTTANYEDDAGVLHTDQHSNANDAIEALQAKVGTNGSAITGTLDYKVNQHISVLADPHVQYQKESEKGAPNGYANLDAGVLVPVAQIPALPESRITNLIPDLASKAFDAVVVHNTGNETISGTKTFNGAPVVPTNAFPQTAIQNLGTDLGTINTQLGLKEVKTQKGVANGYAGLDATTMLAPANSRNRLLVSNTTTGNIVNTITETTSATWTIPAGSIGTGDVVRIHAAGDFLNNTGAGVNYTFRLKFDTATVFLTAANSMGQTTNRRFWILDVIMYNPTTTSQRYSANINTSMGVLTNNWDLPSTIGAVGGGGVSSVNTSTNRDITFTVQMGTANALADWRCHVASLMLFKV